MGKSGFPVRTLSLADTDPYKLVLVQLSDPGDYTIRIASILPAQLLAGRATLRYRNADLSTKPTATVYIDDRGKNTTVDVTYFNETQMKMYPPSPISAVADQTVKLSMRPVGFSYEWSLGHNAYMNENLRGLPLLLKDSKSLMALAANNPNTTIATRNNTWVDLLFITGKYPLPPHPIHKQ